MATAAGGRGLIAKAITAVNIAVSLGLWLPSWRKMIRTRSSRDYSLFSFLLVLYLQVANFGLAVAEKSWLFGFYMAANVLAVGVTCWLIWKYQK